MLVLATKLVQLELEILGLVNAVLVGVRREHSFSLEITGGDVADRKVGRHYNI